MGELPEIEALRKARPAEPSDEDAAPEELPIFAPDGSLGTVSRSKYWEALSNGYGLPVTAPDGTQGSIPASRLEEAKRAGYTPSAEHLALERAHEAKKYDNPFAAGALGAARALTLGGSDLALTAHEPGVEPIMRPETLRGLKEHNTFATPFGEGVGLVGAALIPGVGEASGVGMVGRAGEAAVEAVGLHAAESVAGRVAGKLLAGGIEGGLFGAGNALSEYAMGEPDLNAQKVIAEIGLGGLLGVGAGGLSSLLEEGTRAAAPKVTEALANLKANAERFRDERVAKAIGAIQSDVNKVSEEKLRQIGQDVFGAGYIKPGDGPREILSKLRTGTREQWDRASAALSKADELSGGEGFSITRVAARARNELLPAVEGDPALAGEARKLKRLIEGYSKLGEETEEGAGARAISFEKAHELDSNLRKSIKPGMASIAEKDSIDKLRSIFRDELGTQLKSVVGEDVSKEFEDAMRKYGSFAEAKKWGIKGINRMQGNRWLSLSDYNAGAIGAMLGGGPAGMATAAIGALGNKLLRERGASVVAHLSQKLAESPVLETISNHFAKAMEKAAPEALGKFAPEMRNAIARGPTDALATHLHLAQAEPAYREAAALAGMPFGEAHHTAAILEKAHGLHNLQHALESHDERIFGAVEKAIHKSSETAVSKEGEHEALRKQDFGTKRMRRSPVEAHKRHVEEVTQLAAHPERLADRASAATRDLGQHAPGTAAALTATGMRAVQFLASKAEKPPKAGPLAQEWHPSQAEIAKFNRYQEAVQDPTALLKHVHRGDLTPEHVEAVRTVYPQLFQQMTQDLLEEAASSRTPVPYTARVMLGLATGTDLDGSLNPASIARNQAILRGPSAKSPSSLPGGQPSVKGLEKLTIANRSQLPSRRLRAGGEE